MRLPRKYKKECKNRFLSFPVPDRPRRAFRDSYKSWIVDLPFIVDKFTWDLRRYVDDGCNSRRNCRNNLNPRVIPYYAPSYSLESLSFALRLEDKLNRISKIGMYD